LDISTIIIGIYIHITIEVPYKIYPCQCLCFVFSQSAWSRTTNSSYREKSRIICPNQCKVAPAIQLPVICIIVVITLCNYNYYFLLLLLYQSLDQVIERYLLLLFPFPFALDLVYERISYYFYFWVCWILNKPLSSFLLSIVTTHTVVIHSHTSAFIFCTLRWVFTDLDSFPFTYPSYLALLSPGVYE